MVVPRLIHPVDVTLKISNRASTTMDVDTREPIQRIAYKAEITVPGQIRESIAKKDAQVERGGRQEHERGYVLFRTVDLNEKLSAIGLTYEAWANGPNAAVNDKITRIGNQSVNVYITRLDPLGHYTDQGGATLVKAYFTDRAPARKTGGA